MRVAQMNRYEIFFFDTIDMRYIDMDIVFFLNKIKNNNLPIPTSLLYYSRQCFKEINSFWLVIYVWELRCVLIYKIYVHLIFYVVLKTDFFKEINSFMSIKY